MQSNEIEVRFSLGGTQPYLDVDIKLLSTGVTAILGDSGSGKTSLLRCIAGLEKAHNGYCSVNGDIWQDNKKFVVPYKRGIGYVFQEANLFEHLTALKNLEYATKRSRQGKKSKLLAKVIDVLGISSILDKFPQQLSGGERQRIAIARALLIRPKLLLMDEPLASLDNNRKQKILPYLERLASEFQLPILYVTHSMDEVIRLADHGVIMSNGKVIAQGTLTELCSNVNLPVYEGEEIGAVLECAVVDVDYKWSLMEAKFSGGTLWLPHHQVLQASSFRVRILANDISICLHPPQDNSILNMLQAELTAITPDQHPAMVLITLRCGSSQLIARLTLKSLSELDIKVGKIVWAMIKSVAIVR